MINPVDGKIVLGGSTQTFDSLQFGLARFNSNGSLDTGFGSGGKVTTQIGNPIGASTQGNALALQTDGKIVLAGSTQSSRIGLARYLATRAQDTTPPVITVPAAVAANATTPKKAEPVVFSASAEDDVDGTLPVTCTPGESGSEFPIGDTLVACSATDAAGNTGSASFVVHVKGASEQIGDLADNIVAALHGGTLPKPARDALERAAEGHPVLACKLLPVVSDWLRLAIRQGKISAAQGRTLTDDITRIKHVLGC